MRITILIIGIAILLSAHARAFAQDAHSPAIIERRVFDEFGDLRSCDRGARLDNYAIALMNEPESSAYVLVYAPTSSGKLIRQSVTNYLVNMHGIAQKRIKTAYGGFHHAPGEPRIHLWIVPKGAAFPEPEKSEVDIATFKGKLSAFQSSDEVDIPFEGDPEEDAVAPFSGNVPFAALDEILKAQKNSIAHIVGFNGAAAVPGAWRRLAESTLADLKRLGVEPGRLKISFGGQSKESQIELWVLPKDEMPPVKDPASEAAPNKAVQMGEYDSSMLGSSEIELAVFKHLLTIMREHRDLVACLIVRMETPVPDDEQPSADTADDAQQPGADLLKLVDKWKSELAAKHKIGPDRVVLLYAKAQPYFVGSVEIWVVPRGRPLPNPDAEQEQASDVVKNPESRP
jgi:hypothetical protein